jgi:hypothetical protein
MSFNFPINPSLNQTYSVGDKTWIYDGRGWKLYTLQFSVVPIYNHANGAFDKANSANSLAQAAFDAANNAGSSEEVQTIFAHANGAFDKANSANNLAQAAFNQANTANVLAQAAFDSGNATYTYASSGYGHANGAFEHSNSVFIYANSAFNRVNTTSLHANSAYDKANSANSLAQAAFDAANNAGSSQEIQVIFAHANGGFDKANSANFLAQAAFDSGNSTFIYATQAYGHANGAFSHANNSYTHANGAFDKANAANVLAQNAYDFANTRYSSSGGTISGDVTVTGNLNITGNIISHSAEDFIVDDPIVLIANNNLGNLTDIGFVAHYEDGGANTKHTGLVRHVSTNTWYLFESYVPHIQENNILNIADPTLVISTLKANLDSQSVIVRGQDVLDRTNAAFNRANTDVTSISTTAGVYGNNTIVPVITLEANGRISSIVNVAISGIGGGTLTWIKKTADYTASVGERIIADTAGGSFILTLPATPTLGSSVTIADGNNWYTNNLTVARNGSTIEGLTEDLILDIEGIQVDFVYDGTTWEVYTFSGPSPFPDPTGNTGKFLTTNGNTTSWSTVNENYVISSFGHANSSYTHANSAYNKANSAYNTANNFSTSATPNTYAYRNATGDLYANNLYANNLVSTSDIRFKNNIQNIDNPIDLLNSLNGVSFNWINTETKSYGLIAQELEKVLPELVSTTNDVKSVMYIPIIAILIEAIKQQQKEIEEIKNGKT